MTLPIELIIVGTILSILNLLAHLIRNIPKFKKSYEKLTKSKQKLESIRESLSNKSINFINDDELKSDDLDEALEIADNFIDLLENIIFNKPN